MKNKYGLMGKHLSKFVNDMAHFFIFVNEKDHGGRLVEGEQFSGILDAVMFTKPGIAPERRCSCDIFF